MQEWREWWCKWCHEWKVVEYRDHMVLVHEDHWRESQAWGEAIRRLPAQIRWRREHGGHLT